MSESATAWNRLAIDLNLSNCSVTDTDTVNCVKKAGASLPVPCPPNTCAAVGRTRINAPWDGFLDKFSYVNTDIEINDTDFDFEWLPCDAADLPFSNYDLTKLMTHEIGHSWGLEHRQCGDEMMLPDGPPSGLNARNINEEEERRIDLLYPYEGRCPAWEWLDCENCRCDVNAGCLHL